VTPVVCIPVRDDGAGLRVTLRSIAAQRPGVPVVVAVDGHDPVVEAVAREAGATVVVLPVSAGSYAARNAALDAIPADADAVLFTDAGCVARPGWVAGHLAALTRADLSGGAVDVTTSSRPTPAEFVDAARNLRQQTYVEVDGFAATCNLAVRRSVIDQMRFDGALRSGGDREFCRRAAAAGFTLTYTPQAVVEHPARTAAARY
jgi:glycosyltransferase involved in cell wall biosynthesis